MTSLHISHTVNDFDEWLTTFNSFADFRVQGGVTSTTVRHAIENPNVVAVDLEFPSADQARSFLKHLESEIWPNSPHFSDTPTSLLLHSATAAV
jgi:hypothetical protein